MAELPTDMKAHNRKVIEEFRANRGVGDQVYEATAVVTSGAERERLFARTVEDYPFFADHQAKISREIPVVALERRTG